MVTMYNRFIPPDRRPEYLPPLEPALTFQHQPSSSSTIQLNRLPRLLDRSHLDGESRVDVLLRGAMDVATETRLGGVKGTLLELAAPSYTLNSLHYLYDHCLCLPYLSSPRGGDCSN